MPLGPELTVSDSGIRIVAPVELTTELHNHFKGDGVECFVYPGEDEDSRRIVFVSPYAIDKILSLFRKWQEERHGNEPL